MGGGNREIGESEVVASEARIGRGSLELMVYGEEVPAPTARGNCLESGSPSRTA